MAERLDGIHNAIKRGRPADYYTQELQRHTLEQLEREVRWLEDLIDSERGTRRVQPRTAALADLAGLPANGLANTNSTNKNE